MSNNEPALAAIFVFCDLREPAKLLLVDQPGIVKMRLAREQAKSHKIAARVRVPACNEQHARSVATRHRAGQDVYQGSPSALSAAAAGCWRRVAPFLGGF